MGAQKVPSLTITRSNAGFACEGGVWHHLRGDRDIWSFFGVVTINGHCTVMVGDGWCLWSGSVGRSVYGVDGGRGRCG